MIIVERKKERSERKPEIKWHEGVFYVGYPKVKSLEIKRAEDTMLIHPKK